MSQDRVPYAVEDVIQTVRGQRVILDADLASLYGVTTKALNQAVKRNRERFPPEFAFVVARQEVATRWSQVVTASAQDVHRQSVSSTGDEKRRFRPASAPITVFTEHGAIMAATVLNSPKAVEMSVFIVKAFVRMRQAMLSRQDLEKRLDQIEKLLLVHDDALKDLYERIRPLLLPPPEPERKPIGFSVHERRVPYRRARSRRREE
jgi:hypothetical protein